MARFLDGDWGRGLLLEYVVLEVATVLLTRRDHSEAAQVCSLLLEAAELDFIECSGMFHEVFDRFERHAGTRLSFTDAAIAHFARKRAEGQVLTFDAEFGTVPGVRIVR